MPTHPNFFLKEMRKLGNEEGFRFFSDIDFNPRNEWDMASCDMSLGNDHVNFKVQQMPGCCAVLTVFYVYPWPRTQDNFLETLRRVEVAAKRAGFGSLLMTQVGEIEDWAWLLAKKWEMNEPFVNAKSGNKVMYLTKNLEQPGKVKGLEV